MKQYSKRLFAVSPCPACFLVIVFKVVWHIHMYHRSHIGLIYTHTKCIGTSHNADLVFYECLLSVTPLCLC